MKVTDSRAVDPGTVTEIRDMLRSGSHHEAVITRMRALGLNKIECMKLLRDFGQLTLGQAKDIVHLSPAWEDSYASDEALHDAAEQAMHRVIEHKRPAA